MAGQPQINPWFMFDVTKMEVFEDPALLQPTIVVPVNSAFTLKATFGGSGVIWGWVRDQLLHWDATFNADGLGATIPEFDLGIVSGNLQVGVDQYEASLTVAAGIAVTGVYELTCWVSFPAASGLTGYIAPPLMIEVHP